jgi:uncharacterized protein
VNDFNRRDASIGPTILLSTGRYFSFVDPSPLTIEEVASALSKICRFTGHCRQFYSVAEHSILVSRLVPPHLAMWGLLHDAVEAVVGDMASPLKRLVPEYKTIEARCEAVILEGFGLKGTMPAEVKHADLVALRTEQRDLMHIAGGLWMSLEGIAPSTTLDCTKPLLPGAACARFLQRYEDLLNWKALAGGKEY